MEATRIAQENDTKKIPCLSHSISSTEGILNILPGSVSELAGHALLKWERNVSQIYESAVKHSMSNRLLGDKKFVQSIDAQVLLVIIYLPESIREPTLSIAVG